MNGLKTFYRFLNSPDQDAFISMINRNSSEVSESVKLEMQERLDRVTKSINKINARREVLGAEADSMERFVVKIDEFSKKVNNNVTLEIVTMRTMFYSDSVRIREKIARSKPIRLLELKHKLRSGLEALDNQRTVYGKMNHVMQLIFKKSNRPKRKVEKADDKTAAVPEKIEETENVTANITE